ncbi:MAG: hypothetical protein AAGH41_00595 [Pseudomonadota bacterium]
MKRSTLSAAAAALALAAGSAHAVPLVWTLEADFDDGSSASGSYTFDADTGVISDVMVETSDGVVFAFDNTGIGVIGADIYQFVSDSTIVVDETIALNFELLDSMTNAGGTIDIDPSAFLIFGGGTGFSFIGTCTTAICDFVGPPFRELTGVTVTADMEAAIPLPAAAWLFVPAFGAMAARARKKAS